MLIKHLAFRKETDFYNKVNLIIGKAQLPMIMYKSKSEPIMTPSSRLNGANLASR